MKKILSAVVTVLLISVMAVPQVFAINEKLFTFVPGVGIVEKNDTAIYAMKPVVRKIESDNESSNTMTYAYLDNAIYTNGYLSINVTVKGKSVVPEDYIIYKNGVEIGTQNVDMMYSWVHDMRFGYYDIRIDTGQPTESDLFEIEIAGFANPLSFTLDACSDYYELSDIGPTDVKNDIPVTAVATKSEDQLTVWCYPFNSTGDKISGIGYAHPSISKNEAYIETESGFKSVYNAAGQRITERFIFDMPAGDNSATLHIPYLTFVHDEKKKLTIPVPEDYVSEPSDISIQFSVGSLRVTEIEKKTGENDINKDFLRIGFAFDDINDNIIFNSFKLSDARGRLMSYMSNYNEETGRLEYIEIEIADKTKKMTFTVSDLCYYLLGEYIIPLDID